MHVDVEAVAPATHAQDQTMFLAKPHPIAASVLGSMIGMNDDLLLGATAPDSHRQSIQDQIPRLRGLHRQSDDNSGV